MFKRILFSILAATLPLLAEAGTAACAATGSARLLDYWLGDWAVASPGSQDTGHSKVSVSLDKCLMIESWGSDTSDHRGENALAYNSEDKTWYGLFADNRGRVHTFKGSVISGAAEFTGPSRNEKGVEVLSKVKIVRVTDRQVEQIWQKSQDQGTSWTTDFRMIYSRK
jgi:hypothetical protein